MGLALVVPVPELVPELEVPEEPAVRVVLVALAVRAWVVAPEALGVLAAGAELVVLGETVPEPGATTTTTTTTTTR
jgi:hypothetical protein